MTPVMFEAFLAKHTVFCLNRVDPISAGRAQPDTKLVQGQHYVHGTFTYRVDQQRAGR